MKPAVRRALFLASAAIASLSVIAEPLKELRLDYAYYSPSSLVIKKFGWLEEEFKPSGTEVKWVLSQGSNRALEFLNSNSVDIGSTAGLAAVLARANGNPIKTVYIYSRPEWTALAVAKDSPIKTVADLKGKKVAATKGTDPYLFLLRALHTAGLKKGDIEHVALQHADGRAALEQGRVDAWAGLDPHLAASELEAGTRVIYRNINFNTYGFLNAREDFAKDHPEELRRVIKVYEKARSWILKNPAEAAKLVSEEAKVPLNVAQLQLKRTDFSNPRPGPEHIAALKEAAPILLEEALVKPGTDLNRTIAELIDVRAASALASN